MHGIIDTAVTLPSGTSGRLTAVRPSSPNSHLDGASEKPRKEENVPKPDIDNVKARG